MSTAFFDSQGLEEGLGRELFDRAARAGAAPVVMARGAGMALSALLPDLAFLLGGVAAVAVMGAVAQMAGTWQPTAVLLQAIVFMALGMAGHSVRWLVAASLNLLLSVAAVYALMSGSLAVAEIVLWQTLLAGVAFTDAARVPGWRQALGAQLGWLLVLSVAL